MLTVQAAGRDYKNLDLTESYTYTGSMRHKLPPLASLRAFESAAYKESFADAARDLCVSHSAISQHIRTLEEWLEVKLFVRSGNRVKLTLEGQALKPKLNEAFNLLAEACVEISQSNREKIVRIVAEPGFSTRWLRPRLKSFRETYPDINVRMQSGTVQDHASESSLDVIIHFEENLDKHGFQLQRLFPIDAFPACSPGYLEQFPNIEKPEDLIGLSLIHDNSHQTWRKWFAQFLPDSEAWKNGYVYSDLSLAIDSALDGEGMFLADDLLCMNELANGTLVKPMNDVIRSTWYGIACTNSDTNEYERSVFIQWLFDTLSQESSSVAKKSH
ncbi:LysR substrate-binding domain-containing protein [Marinomonas epiphytica]